MKRYSGLNEKCPQVQVFIYFGLQLVTWSRDVMALLGHEALLEKVHHWRETLRVYRLAPLSKSFVSRV